MELGREEEEDTPLGSFLTARGIVRSSCGGGRGSFSSYLKLQSDGGDFLPPLAVPPADLISYAVHNIYENHILLLIIYKSLFFSLLVL